MVVVAEAKVGQLPRQREKEKQKKKGKRERNDATNKWTTTRMKNRRIDKLSEVGKATPFLFFSFLFFSFVFLFFFFIWFDLDNFAARVGAGAKDDILRLEVAVDDAVAVAVVHGLRYLPENLARTRLAQRAVPLESKGTLSGRQYDGCGRRRRSQEER